MKDTVKKTQEIKNYTIFQNAKTQSYKVTQLTYKSNIIPIKSKHSSLWNLQAFYKVHLEEKNIS